jgi:hypothetical protein
MTFRTDGSAYGQGLRHAQTPSWLPPDYPPDCRIRIRPAGRDWDAVRAPFYLGETALDELGDECGAVIYDPRESALYWLVKAGATAGWAVPYTRALGETHHVAVPAAVRTAPPGVHWLIPPGERTLTDAQLLHDALTTAVRTHLGPREGAVS